MLDLLTTLAFTGLAFALGYLIGRWNHTCVHVDNYVVFRKVARIDGEEWKDGGEVEERP